MLLCFVAAAEEGRKLGQVNMLGVAAVLVITGQPVPTVHFYFRFVPRGTKQGKAQARYGS